MSDQTLKLSKSDYIKWIISIVSGLILFLIPSVGWYTTNIKLFFVITVVSLLLIAFELLPSAVIAIVMPVLYIILAVAPVETVMSPWVGEIMPMLIGAFMLSAMLQQSGLLTRLAYYLMAKVNGSYTKMLFGIFFVGIVLTFLTFGTGYLILAPLCAGLCATLALNKNRMAAGIAFACMLGSCTAKIFTYPISDFAYIIGCSAGLADDLLPQLTFINVIIHNIPMFFICVLTLFIVAKWYKPEPGKELKDTDYFKKELASLGKISRTEKMNGIILGLVVVYTLLCSFIGMDIYWGFMLVPWLGFLPFIRAADKTTLTKMDWSTLFFTSGCMSIGNTASYLGFGDILSNVMSSTLQGGNTFLIIAGCFLIVFVANFLMTPMAIWALLAVPFMQLAISLGFEKLPFLYLLFSASEAIILPYEYIPYLVIYAFGMMRMKDFIKLNILRCIIFFLGFLFILVPYWMLIGIL